MLYLDREILVNKNLDFGRYTNYRIIKRKTNVIIDFSC